MGLAALRERIQQLTKEGLVEEYLQRAAIDHRKNWQSCLCRWCVTKREATRVIANVPAGDRFIREHVRWSRRNQYRKALREEFEADGIILSTPKEPIVPATRSWEPYSPTHRTD